MSPGPQACNAGERDLRPGISGCPVEGTPPSSGPNPGISVDPFLISFGLIFVAELGDKSQLMAMTFAARYRAVTILAAITAATAVVHLFSVLLGAAVGVALPIL